MEIQNLVEKFERELAVLIAVQHLGQPTKEEIKQYIDTKLKSSKGEKFSLQIRSIKRVCTILQKKGLISQNYASTDTGQEEVYNMQKGYVKFPEIAQIKDIIKEESLKVYLEKLEDEKGIQKEKNKYDYYLCGAVWEVIDGIAGFIPNSDGINSHYRDKKNNIYFLPNHFKKYLALNMPKANRSQYEADMIGTNYGFANLNGSKTTVAEHFVLVRGDIKHSSGGAGKKQIEMLPPKTEISTVFSVPSNKFAPEQFKAFLLDIGENGIAGFGAYSSRWGKVKLKDFGLIKPEKFQARYPTF